MFIELTVVTGETFRAVDYTLDELIDTEEIGGDLRRANEALTGILDLIESPDKIGHLTLECDDDVTRHFNGDHIVYATFHGGRFALTELRGRIATERALNGARTY